MHIEVFSGTGGDWFWHFKNKGRITANAEAFPSKANAMRGAKGVVTAVCKEAGGRRVAFTTEKVQYRLASASNHADDAVKLTWF